MTRCEPAATPSGMANLDLMNDPFYAQLMFLIESCISKADRDGQGKGVRLTDSNIKSALNKARHLSVKPVPDPLEVVETREDIIHELATSIAANRELFRVETETASGKEKAPISSAEWVKAISAVEASLKVRRSDEPGSRCYLDFVGRFIEEGRL